MKKSEKMVLLLIMNIILIGIFYNIIYKNEVLINEKQILKEMTTSEKEQELENEITGLNTSATEYATYVQNCKSQIANAITAKGVATSETDSVDVMVANIEKLNATSQMRITGNNVGSLVIKFIEPGTYTKATAIYGGNGTTATTIEVGTAGDATNPGTQGGLFTSRAGVTGLNSIDITEEDTAICLGGSAFVVILE